MKHFLILILIFVSSMPLNAMKKTTKPWPDAIATYEVPDRRWADEDEFEVVRKELKAHKRKIESHACSINDGNMLFYAAKFDELLRYTNFLLNHGANSYKSVKGILPLDNAIRHGALKSAYLLTERGAACKTALLTLMKRVCVTKDPKAFAAQQELFKLLLKNRASVNAKDSNQETPLFKILDIETAEGQGAWPTVRFISIPLEHRAYFVTALLNNNADPRLKNAAGKTATQKARENGFEPLAQLIADSEAKYVQ